MTSVSNQGLAEESGPRAIAWRANYSEALEEARQSKRLLWIQFTGPWCPSCVRMEQDSFADRSVIERAEHDFVSVKLRADENQELALGFDVSGLPATVIVAPSRKVIEVRQGYMGPDELSGLLRSTADRTRPEPAKTQLAMKSGARPDLSPTQSESVPSSRPKMESQVELSGYCPVSLVSDKRLVPGQTEYTVTHEGRLYRFANLLTFNLFRGDPARYVPVNQAECPVAKIDRGEKQAGVPRFGVLYQGRLFLCSSAEDRRRFVMEPTRYAAVDVSEDGNCPHCLASQGTQVQGDPRYDLNVEGRRYWFPDESHRAAYLAGLSQESARR